MAPASYNATVKTNNVWKGAIGHMLEQHSVQVPYMHTLCVCVCVC